MTILLQYSSIVGSFLILCGALKFYLYYKAFNISIFRFFDLQEILTLFMDNLLAYLSIVTPTAVFFFLFYLKSKEKLSSLNISTCKLVLDQWPLILAFILITAVGALIFFLKAKKVTKKDLAYISLLISICYILAPFLFVILKRSLESDYNIKLPAVVLFAFLLAILLITYSFFTAMNEINKVKILGFYKNVEIVLKNEELIVCDEQHYFIGMTRNYFFVYDGTIKTCTAHKIDELKSIRF